MHPESLLACRPWLHTVALRHRLWRQHWALVNWDQKKAGGAVEGGAEVRRRMRFDSRLGAVTVGLAALLCLVDTPCTGGLAGASQEGERVMGETLDNGIRLPAVWPPGVETLTLEPMRSPYLASAPEAIPIDFGRQLFVDDFLVEHTTLRRTFHRAEYYEGNPVVTPDKPWEMEGGHPTAMVFSDGVWYDPAEGLFKMWYMGGYCGWTCYATSKDGIHWEKPALEVVPGTNIVHPVARDSGTVWLDLEGQDPTQRYKMFIYPMGEGRGALWVYFSSDGIHWGDPVARSGGCGDRSTVFWNPFRKVWVFSLREGLPELGRVRRYREHREVIAACEWNPGEAPLWTGADRLDPRRADLDVQPQLYNLDCVGYESIVLGLFSIWYGQPSDRPKPNQVCAGFSRDGFYWHRPSHEAFIPVSERQGDWNWGNVQSAGGCCLVVGDRLYFYVSGRAGVPGTSGSGVCGTGLALLRRDGFASMDAGDEEGTLTTRALLFHGKHLFVNLDAEEGELRVEVLDGSGGVITPFSAANCIPMEADRTLQAVRWRGAADLFGVAGRPVKFRFHLRRGRLYAFWVSADSSGASHGYVAAGGPGLTGSADTVGSAGYRG